jgi:hypothetical protein
MSRTENVELTVLCLITDGDRILLQPWWRQPPHIKIFTDIGGNVIVKTALANNVANLRLWGRDASELFL